MKWAVQTRLGPNRAPPVISPQPDDMMHAVTTLKLARAHACCARVEAPSGELRRVCAGRPGQLLPLMCWCVTSMLSPPGRPSGSLKSLLRACLCGAACNLPSTQPMRRPRRLLGCHAETEASLLGQLCGSPSTPPNSHMATDVAWLSSAFEVGGWWSAAEFVRLLARSRARAAPVATRAAVTSALALRWSALLAFAAARSFAAALSRCHVLPLPTSMERLPA